MPAKKAGGKKAAAPPPVEESSEEEEESDDSEEEEKVSRDEERSWRINYLYFILLFVENLSFTICLQAS